MKALVKVIDGETKVRFPLTRILHRIGRGPSCDLSLDGEDVSRHHVEITQTDEGVFVRDLRSANGTFINDQPIEFLHQLEIGDRLVIGSHLLILIDEQDKRLAATMLGNEEHARNLRLPDASFPPDIHVSNDATERMQPGTDPLAHLEVKAAEERRRPRLIVCNGPNAGAALALVLPEVSIGRAPECNLVLPDKEVSARHARLVERRGGHYVYDARSLNGVLVNGHRVRGVRLQPGDTVRLGNTELRYEDPARPTAVPLTTAPNDPFSENAPSVYGPWPWVGLGLVCLAAFMAVGYLVL